MAKHQDLRNWGVVATNCRVGTITPEFAAKLLEGNEGNRSQRRSVLSQYGASMAKGEWELNGETIKISESGRLLDGQHRLVACVQTGVSFDAYIIYGIEDRDRMFATIDAGSNRTQGDLLATNGVADATAVASALRALYLLIHHTDKAYGSRSSQVKIRREELLDFERQHSGIRDWVSTGKLCNARLGTSPALVTAIAYLFSQARGRVSTETFFDAVIDAAGLESGDPRLTLREMLTREAVAKGRSKSHRASSRGQSANLYSAALFIKAFNAWWSGSKIKLLRVYENEAFPRISGDTICEVSEKS